MYSVKKENEKFYVYVDNKPIDEVFDNWIDARVRSLELETGITLEAYLDRKQREMELLW
jgi:hypothetical protein